MDNNEERRNMSLGLKNSLVSSFGRRDSQSLTSPVSSKSVPLVSPMTSLAIELGNSSMRTPRRRLSMSSIESNTPRSPLDIRTSEERVSETSDQGYHTESSSEPVTPLFSPSDSILLGVVGFLPTDVDTPKRSILRRPSVFAASKQLPCSQEDDKENVVVSQRSSQKVNFEFARPTGVPLRRKTFSGMNKQSPILKKFPTSPSSPMSIMLPPNIRIPSVNKAISPCQLSTSKINKQTVQSLPSGFSDLMDKPIIAKTSDLERSFDFVLPKEAPSMSSAKSAICCPLKCPSELLDCSMNSPLKWRTPAVAAVKRSNAGLSPSLGEMKKMKMRASSLSDEADHSLNPGSLFTNTDGSPMRRCRSLSFTSPFIDRAFGIGCEDANLIGDFSKPHALPIYNKNKGLKNITGQTLSDLMRQKYADEIGHYIIVDCRYPYEYQGGHIKGAENLYQKDQIIDFFLKEPLNPPSNGLRLVIIFHCEFSSQRGPSMCDFLRARDRAFHANSGDYPTLYYPELYLLSGGYKAFYADFKELCEPNGYTQMNDENHSKDLTVFLRKAKSWSGEPPRAGRKVSIRKW